MILSADDYDAIMETVEILGDPGLVAAIRVGEAEIESGEGVGLDDVADAMRSVGRPPA